MAKAKPPPPAPVSLPDSPLYRCITHLHLFELSLRDIMSILSNLTMKLCLEFKVIIICKVCFGNFTASIFHKKKIFFVRDELKFLV